MSNRFLAVAALAAALVLAPSLAVAAAHDGGAPRADAPPGAASAQARPDAEPEKEALEEQIRREMGRSTAPSATAEARAGGQATTGPNPMARLLVLPDISAIGSVSATWDDETEKPAFAFEELELAFQAVVDPYLRADVYVAFSDEGAELEEAFVTTLGLPAGLQVKAGKLFTPFGRMNQMHPHVWEFVDAPLARSRLLAEETLSGAGVDLGWLLPTPWYAELRLAAQSTAPGEEDEARLTGTARLAQFFSLGEGATLGVGVSGARRDEAPGQFRDLGGADVYLRLRPPESRSYVTLSGELYARRFVDVPDVSGDLEHGWWAQAFGRVGRFAGAGVRYERAPLEDGSGDQQRASALLAWLPSEFQRLRLQVGYDRLPDDTDGVSAILNLEFGIGAHGAHPF
jgi:hypothetical protein